MRAEEYGVYEKRLNKFISRLKDNAPLLDEIPFNAEYRFSKDPVPFADRLKGEYKPIQKGDKWGDAWDSAWFKLTATVPHSWDGKEIVAHLSFNGESLVFGSDGCPLFGLTNGSVFAVNYGKDVYYFNRCAKGGETIELWVEAAANHLFGINVPGDPARACPTRHGTYEGRVVNCELCLFSRDTWHLLLDMNVLSSLIAGLRAPSVNTNDGNAWGSLKKLIQLTPRMKKILHTANLAITAYADNTANAAKAREVLKPLFATPANASDLSINAVGHAHIDTGWLWPVRESIRKCGRTFASQIALIEKYPGFVFGASQPQLYQFTKDHYPALYEKIKKHVKSGQWECQGGMWVEADCNITGGEAMVRQFLTGKNFYMDEFGFDVKNLWIPDVFGYSAAMPQIMKKCGVDFFLTQKISWSQFNEFPHNTFRWRGIDGSEVLTHFPPEDGYNSDVMPSGQLFAQKNFKESHILDEAMCLYGIGDGGGGPKEEHVEQVLRMNDLEGCPKVKFGRADDFFNRINAFYDQFECWNGELYLELHRGTLTTQARVKKGNRMLERKLREAEFICSCLPFAEYPGKELDRLWKVLLINQFHDILPGSSVRKVYEVTEREHADSIAACDALIAKAAAKLLQPSADALTLVNLLSTDYTAPVTLPASWKGCGVTDLSGKALPVQEDENGVTVLATIPACGTLGIRKAGAAAATAKTSGLVLENDLIRYEFAKDGTIVRAFDKEAGREVLTAGEKGNLLSLYVDRPNDWDAWDIEITYPMELAGHASAANVTPLAGGDVRKGIKFSLIVGQSKVEQSVYLNAGSKRLDFVTDVDWQEMHKMLRVSFPVNVVSSEASFDIQYGFAKRATHTNTSWDMAKFEVAAHKYADLSADGYGVAILNNCKYGHKVQDNVLDLNLLRSPTYPDADADIGMQSFTYSLLPHTGDLTSSAVQAEAGMLNFPPVVLEGSAAQLNLPVAFHGEGVSLEVVKKAEKENCHVIRIAETKGRTSTCNLTLQQGSGLIATNMMEWTAEGELPGRTHQLTLKPFEILTFKIKG